jgi:hypothetical protein
MTLGLVHRYHRQHDVRFVLRAARSSDREPTMSHRQVLPPHPYRYGAVSRLRPDGPLVGLAIASSAGLAAAGAEAFLHECEAGRPGRPAGPGVVALLRRHLVVGDATALRLLGVDLDAWAATPAGEPCPICAVEIRTAHLPGCDYEQCPRCGGQLTACGCPPPAQRADRLPWSGEPPGAAEARAIGWFVRAGDDGWVRCGSDDVGATPDIERVFGPETRWDPSDRRFVLRAPAWAATAARERGTRALPAAAESETQAAPARSQVDPEQ